MRIEFTTRCGEPAGPRTKLALGQHALKGGPVRKTDLWSGGYSVPPKKTVFDPDRSVSPLQNEIRFTLGI
jgi:hypothetical protein